MTWLKNMKIEPMPYRMGLYSKIAENINLKEEICNTGVTLIQLFVDSSAKFTEKSRCRGDTNAVPIWRLMIIYQACILHPAPLNRPVGKTLVKIIHNRLLRFRQGNVALSLDQRTRKRQYVKQWDQWIELLRRVDI